MYTHTHNAHRQWHLTVAGDGHTHLLLTDLGPDTVIAMTTAGVCSRMLGLQQLERGARRVQRARHAHLV
jgi:hypothetical protein